MTTLEMGAPGPATDTLYERGDELDRITGALDGAAKGVGQFLVIEGPAGIGKTSLLEQARALARDRGLQLFGARATEIDRDLAFGVARQLFEAPVTRATPQERARLLAGSASPAAPALDQPGGPVTAEMPTSALYGLFWLLCNLVERGPALVTVDDAHWSDPASTRLLTFLAPRLPDIGCVLVATVRTDEPGRELPLAGTASDPASRSLRLRPLSSRSCVALIASELGVDPEPPFAVACHALTGGNPFLLRAVIDEMRRAGRVPSAESAAWLESISPRAVSRVALTRLAAFGEEACRAVQALAVLGRPSDLTTLAQVAALDQSTAAAVVELLERALLVRGTDTVDFVHPLIRNAVYTDLGRRARSDLHRRAAECLVSVGADPESVAAHVLHTVPSGRQEAVVTLRRAAAGALERGAPDMAAAYLHRALAEPAPAESRQSVLLQLGLAETATDLDAALGHLRLFLEADHDPHQGVIARLALARSLFYADRPSEAAAVIDDALAALDGGGDDELRALLEAVLLACAQVTPELTEVAAGLAARRGRPEGRDLGSQALAAGLLHREARSGVPAAQVVEQAEALLDGGVLMSGDNGRAGFDACVLILSLADHERALAATDTGARVALDRGDPVALAGNRTFAAFTHLLRGELVEAVAAAEEGLRGSIEHGNRTGLPWAAAFLALAELERGEVEAAEAALARVDPGPVAPDTAHWHWYLLARAGVLSASGHPRAGLDLLLEAGRRFEAVGGRNPAFLPWRSEAALLLGQLGEPARAVELAAQEVAAARVWGAPRALAAALRAHALVAGAGGAEELQEAAQLLEDSPAKLEQARTLIALGAVLRRAGQRGEARAVLRRGCGLARACGAVPLAEQGHQELLAAGARPRQQLLTGVEALTPSELRVARLAASGATNRAIAQALFVTEKTVEYHLCHAYRKLEIAGRLELAAVLPGEGSS